MPIDASIPLQIKTPDLQTSLGQMIGLGTAKLNLDRQRATFDSDIAQKKAESSQAQQMVEPTVSTAKTGAESAQFSLTQQQLQRLQNDATALSNDPDVDKAAAAKTPEEAAQYVPAIVAKVERHLHFARGAGVPETMVNTVGKQLLDVAQNDPSGLQQFLIQRQKAGVGAGGQIAASNPQGVGIGNGIQTGILSTNQYGSNPVGQTIPGSVQTQMVPLAQQQNMGSDSMGNPIVSNKDAMGNIVNVSGAPVQGQTDRTAPFVIPPGESPETLKQMQGIRQSSNSAAASAPVEHFNNQQIIRLANETNTGVGAEMFSKLGGQYAGVPWSSDTAENFNKLGHFVALQNAQKAQQAGLGGSDAARELAAQSTASTTWTKGAIISATKVNDALTTGSQMFNAAMEKSVAQGGPFAARQLQNAWAQVADVDAMRLYNAKKAGDSAEYNQIVSQYGGPKSTKFQQLMFKTDKMSNLIKNGVGNGQ